MQDIVDYLFEYVQEHRLAFYLNADPEYQNAGRMAERAADWLAANLGPEARGQLERLTDCSLEQGDLTERALFRCGLSLGLELGALSRPPG